MTFAFKISQILETVVLKTFDNYFSANILLSRLEQNGVRAWLFDENTVTIGPFFGNAIGFIKVVVSTADAEAALDLLRQFEQEAVADAVCPQCGSTGFLPVASDSGSNKVTAMLTWLFSNYAIAPETVYRCENCGFEASTPPESDSDKPAL